MAKKGAIKEELVAEEPTTEELPVIIEEKIPEPDENEIGEIPAEVENPPEQNTPTGEDHTIIVDDVKQV